MATHRNIETKEGVRKILSMILGAITGGGLSVILALLTVLLSGKNGSSHGPQAPYDKYEILHSRVVCSIVLSLAAMGLGATLSGLFEQFVPLKQPQPWLGAAATATIILTAVGVYLLCERRSYRLEWLEAAWGNVGKATANGVAAIQE